MERFAAALASQYRIERELGRGGMATVYLAEDVRHRRKVALKVLHPELSAVLGPERFLKEIELTASLQHPHILPLFDSGSSDGQIHAVHVNPGPSFKIGSSEVVATIPRLGEAWDVDRQSGRMVLSQAVATENTRIVVLVNWLDEFRRTAAATR
ncbi:MAG: hypothetical protein JF602_03730 [Gemmatimonadetes bacterium]|nr:hypothetical protein [Gemmatimonadota bacterium]